MEWQTAPPTDQRKPWEMEWQGSAPAAASTSATTKPGFGQGLWEGLKSLVAAPWTIGHVLDQPPIPPVPADFDPSKVQYHPSLQNMINRIGAAVEPWRQNPAYEAGKIVPFAAAGGVGAAVPEEALSSLPARAAYGAKEGAKEAARTFDIYHPLTVKPLVKGGAEAVRAMGRYGTPESVPYTTGAGIPLSDLGDPYGRPVVPPLARGESRQIPYEANPQIPLMETGGTGPIQPPLSKQVMHRAGPATPNTEGKIWLTPNREYASQYGEPTAHEVSFANPLDLRDVPADARYSADDFGALLEARGVKMTPELKAQMKQVEASGDGKAYPFMFTRSPEFTKAVQDSGFDITHLNERFGNGPAAQSSFVSNPNQIRPLGPSALVPAMNIPFEFKPGLTVMPSATGYPETVGMHNAITLANDIGQPLQSGINLFRSEGKAPKWTSSK